MSQLQDPRVLLAAERTLMAWNRTAVSLMAFGFAVERFGLFLELYVREDGTAQFQRGLSFVGGQGFILLGVLVAYLSLRQHRTLLRALSPAEIPLNYRHYGIAINAIVGLMGMMLSLYLVIGIL
jgi:putative membrane protein